MNRHMLLHFYGGREKGGTNRGPAARGEQGLYRDTLFIIPQIETSPASANLPHNSNEKMDSAFAASQSHELTMVVEEIKFAPPTR